MSWVEEPVNVHCTVHGRTYQQHHSAYSNGVIPSTLHARCSCGMWTVIICYGFMIQSTGTCVISISWSSFVSRLRLQNIGSSEFLFFHSAQMRGFTTKGMVITYPYYRPHYRRYLLAITPSRINEYVIDNNNATRQFHEI